MMVISGQKKKKKKKSANLTIKAHKSSSQATASACQNLFVWVPQSTLRFPWRWMQLPEYIYGVQIPSRLGTLSLILQWKEINVDIKKFTVERNVDLTSLGAVIIQWTEILIKRSYGKKYSTNLNKPTRNILLQFGNKLDLDTRVLCVFFWARRPHKTVAWREFKFLFLIRKQFFGANRHWICGHTWNHKRYHLETALTGWRTAQQENLWNPKIPLYAR